jgi:outer membrane protein TolC
MKIIIILIILTVAGCFPLSAQDESHARLKEVLAAIEENNTTLKALRETADAQKLENKTGIYPVGPEAAFNYLWGNPGNIGNRTDVSIKQTFDIPTVTGMKSRMADKQNNLVELQYKAARMNILLEAKQYCIELIYCNALMRELDVRLKHAEILADGYRVRFNSGDASRLEYNKIQLNLSTVQGEMSRIDTERNALHSQLGRLNGGIDVMLDDAQFGDIPLPVDFEQWIAQAAQKNPILEYARQETEVGKRQVSLSKAMGLPSFSAGYMSEKVVGQQYRGVMLGVSIPLWENRNRVKQAKAAARAFESHEADGRQQFYSRLQMLYGRIVGLKTTAEACRRSLATASNAELLKKALDAGEISLLDYILEMSLYYSTVNRALEAERDYQKACAELAATEL